MILMLVPIAAAFAQDVVGKWKLDDGSAIVEVYKQGDVFNGKIVWLEKPTEADGTPAVDDLNPDPQLRTRQVLGLNMLSGLKKNGGEYSGGSIYDPGNGKTLFSKVMADVCDLEVFKIDLGDVENESAICRHIKKTFVKASKSKGPS